jgi:hypothetical protein
VVIVWILICLFYCALYKYLLNLKIYMLIEDDRSYPLSHLVSKTKPNAHSMCAQESSLHTYHTENGYRITNATIYNIFTE